MKPIGSLVSLYYDSMFIAEEGDVISTRTGRSYRVVGNRVQEKGKHKGRQHLKCLVIDPREVTEEDTVFFLHWYKR